MIWRGLLAALCVLAVAAASNAMPPQGSSPPATVRIVGVPEVGSKMVPAAPVAAGATCQWLSNGSAITGATSCASYTVQAGDVGNTLALQVTTAGKTAYAALTISGTPPSTGTVGSAYSFTPTTTGGSGSNTFSQTGSLPPGVNFSSSTGVLSGTPSTAGTYSGLNIGVSDSAGASAWLTPFQITVASGGGGNTYVAQGVHFDWQWSHLYTAGAGTGTSTTAPTTPKPLTANYGSGNVTVADSPKFTASYWVRGVPYNANVSPQTYGMIDIASNVEVSGESAEAFPGNDNVFDHSGPGYNVLRLNFGSGPNGVTSTGNCNYSSNAVVSNLPQVDTGGWVHVVYSFDGSSTTSQFKNVALYINGQEVGSGGCTAPSTAAFNVAFSNPNGWAIVGNLATGTTGTSSPDVADVYLDMQHSIVCTGANTPATMFGQSVTCTAANTIPPEMLAKFADAGGNPVDLGNTCQNPTGSTPEICFTGGATGFAAGNKGTAVGSSTGWVTQNVFADTYGPGANGTPAHQPYIKGIYGDPIGGLTSPQSTTSLGVKINPGDLIIAYLKLENTSSPPAGNTFGISCPSGYTNAITQLSTSNVPNNDVICWKIAGSSESDALSWSWTTAPTRNGTWVTMIIGGANQSNPIQAIAGQNQGATSGTSTWTAPTVTATQANQLLLTVMDTWRAASSTYTLSVPSGEARVFTGYSGGDGTVVNDELTTGAGSLSGRTASLTSGVGGASATDSGMALSILINPN